MALRDDYIKDICDVFIREDGENVKAMSEWTKIDWGKVMRRCSWKKSALLKFYYMHTNEVL